jgi:hypothetical protein
VAAAAALVLTLRLAEKLGALTVGPLLAEARELPLLLPLPLELREAEVEGQEAVALLLLAALALALLALALPEAAELPLALSEKEAVTRELTVEEAALEAELLREA